MKIYPEPIYDLDELARYNLHVHTTYSKCAKPEMTVKNILEEAERAGLEMLALTDHYNDRDFDEEYLAQNETLKAQCAMAGSKVKVLFSSELSCYGPGKFLEKAETAAKLDYRLYSCNHFHLDFWEHPEDKSPRGYAVFAMLIIRELLKSGRADCVAHPFIGRFVKIYEDRTLMTKEMQDNELGELCELARDSGTAFELNTGAVMGDPDLFRRLFNLGREAGTTFHFGTDAHRIVYLDTRQSLPRMKEILL